VHRLGRADADQDSEHLHNGSSLRHRGIKPIAAPVRLLGTGIQRCSQSPEENWDPWYRHRPWELLYAAPQLMWDCLRESAVRIEVRVMAAAAVASPPTGIQRELHQVCESWFSARSCCRATDARLLLTHTTMSLPVIALDRASSRYASVESTTASECWPCT
jgi:hypothetical protein